MKKLVLLMLLTVGSLCFFCIVKKERTYRVPNLHGPDVFVSESKLDTITPLGWAMMLDIVGDDATLEAYIKQCNRDRDLKSRVDRYFYLKCIIDIHKK